MNSQTLTKKRWRHENPEKVKAISKRYSENNKEKLKKRWKEYRERNKEKRKEQKRLWYEKNREKCLEYSKEYYKKNKLKIKEYMKEWAYKNSKLIKQKQMEKYPEKVIARKVVNNHIRRIPNNQFCELCKKHLAVHKHHVDYSKPLLIKYLCRGCHDGIHHREIK